MAAFLQNNTNKSCISASNKQKHNRKRKYIESREEQLHGPGNSNDPKLIDKTSKRATRRSTYMKNFALTSLFCSCHEEKVNLHQLEASKDRTLRQRLSEGDKHRALSNASSRTVHHEDDIMKGNC